MVRPIPRRELKKSATFPEPQQTEERRPDGVERNVPIESVHGFRMCDRMHPDYYALRYFIGHTQ